MDWNAFALYTKRNARRLASTRKILMPDFLVAHGANCAAASLPRPCLLSNETVGYEKAEGAGPRHPRFLPFPRNLSHAENELGNCRGLRKHILWRTRGCGG